MTIASGNARVSDGRRRRYNAAVPSRDVITLRGMRFHTRVGVLPHEGQIPQPLEVDLTVYRARPAGDPVAPAAPRVRDYRARYDIVGPVCETGDTFAVDRELPVCRAGDLVLIKGAGAYGASMASNYNSRPLLAEILIDGHRYAMIRRRQTYEELFSAEPEVAEWAPT